MTRALNPSNTIVIADDDMDACLLIQELLATMTLANELHFVGDGEELLTYLQGRGKYANRRLWGEAGLILLDFQMPRKSGYEALSEIQADPTLSGIPVVVLVNTPAEVERCCQEFPGANACLSKPLRAEDLIDVIRTFAPAGSEGGAMMAYSA